VTFRQVVAVSSLVLVAAACTGEEGEPSAVQPTGRCSPGPDCRIQVVSGDARYLLECMPVAEALVDVELPHEPGRRTLRAITGVSSTQAVAVLWREPDGCGLWTLALAQGLSDETSTSIRDEIGRGVQRFGVTASPVPDEPERG